MNIEYGNREGQYFRQGLFYTLTALLGQIALGPSPTISTPIDCQNPRIWYDNRHDFHHLSFIANGHCVNVKLYKVFSCYFDGEEGWIGCPTYGIHEYARYIRDELRKVPTPI